MANIKDIIIEPEDIERLKKYGFIQRGYYRIKVNRDGSRLQQVVVTGEIPME